MRRYTSALTKHISPCLGHVRTFRTTTALLGIVPFKLADIGEGILKVEVLKVFVKEGDPVEEFDNICEVQSDKATVTITSKVAGKVQKLYIAQGETAHVGNVIADFDVPSSNEIPKPTAPIQTQSTIPAPNQTIATPRGKSIVPFKLADIGEGILKVEVLKVFVKEGDTVEEFDNICEVQSDKATVTITSKVAGKVEKLYIAQGATAHVGSVIADFAIEKAADTAHQPIAAPSAPSASPAAAVQTPTASSGNDKVLATPATRHIARERNVNLSLVPPTGKGGRVTKEDVLRYLEGGATATPKVQSSSAAGPTPVIDAFASLKATKDDRVVPIVGVRRAMVRSMTEANKIPSFGASDEIELTKLMRLRDEMKPLLATRDEKLKLSFMPFFLKAASLALLRFPELNAYTNDDCTELVVKGSHNIGFAMDTPVGLVVPNIKHVETKSIFDLAVEMQSLMHKGAKGAFAPTDLQGGTFTISNIGSIGATYTKPIVFPPQVAIGAIGRMQKVPRFDKNDNVIKAHIINISWSADHRVVDGATMVRFNNLFKAYIEQPALMLMDSK